MEKDPLQALKDLLTDPSAPQGQQFVSDVNYAIKLVEEHRDKEEQLLLKAKESFTINT